MSVDDNHDFDVPGLEINGERAFVAGGRHRVDRAYCEEMSEVVDIEEAQAYCLDDNAGVRMAFECSDSGCRERLHPEIIGVNYHVPPEDENLISQPPHFRWKADDAHFIACYWIADYIARMQHAGRNVKRRSSNPNRDIVLRDVGDVVDEFVLDRRERSDPEENVIQTSGDAPVGRLNRSVERRLNALSEGKVTSTFLERIARCFEALCDADQEKEAALTIDGVRRPYLRWFRGIGKFREDIGPRIYIASAQSLRRLRHGYWLQFYDKVDVDGKRDSHMWISLEELDRYRYRGTLRAALQRIADSPKDLYAKCYFFGGFQLDDQLRARATYRSLSHVFIATRERSGR